MDRVAEWAIKVRDLPTGELSLRVANNPTFQAAEALGPILERGRELWHDTPHQSKALFKNSIKVLEAKNDWPKKGGEIFLARAWAYYGNACRILYEFADARASYEEAHRYVEAAQPAPILVGELAWLEGLLHKERQQHRVANTKLRQAIQLLPISGAPTRCLDAKITLANSLSAEGRLTESIEILAGLVGDYPSSAFPGEDTYLASLQSLATAYAQAGHVERAENLLPRVRHIARTKGHKPNELRVTWLEGEIFRSRNQPNSAISRYQQVQEGFLAADIPLDAAMAGLARAEMYLELDDSTAAADLAERLVPLFREKGIHREATIAGLIADKALGRKVDHRDLFH